ncbi:MAG: UbiD family decarboxylase [Acidobacteria bacterium]|nr:UbiD family decarboxylase [Acidobacteriota bacterium]MCA1637732.1 UbiD family decarboxylase [Acidobacteriota bacterium]
MHKNLRSFIKTLREENDLIEIEAEVDPYLELAEIHRRVIEKQGAALLFKNIKGSKYPVITNLFGTAKRIEIGFGKKPQELVKKAVEMVEVLLPPKPKELWQFRDLAFTALKLGTKKVRRAPVLEVSDQPANLDELPILTTWHEDGGAFITLPLVYTESPTSGKHNLGMYRIQRHDARTTGIHWQIHKGGGFHYFEAEQRNESLPVTIFLGGAPAMILSAIAPLPEDVPELVLASVLADGKIETVQNPIKNHHRIIAEAEFAICGRVPTKIRQPEGPFGDHYGYYSLEHDYPILNVEAVFHRKDAIYPATVVGKPRKEDFFIGDYLQELLSPLFPLVMPAVKDLWSYGETGFHSLAAAVVKERYAREALGAGFRILGEGQLSLTKFLLLTDKPQDLRNFKSLFEHILARVNWQNDFFIFDRTSFDTLDYASGKINHGSKAMLVGVGDAIRDLKREYNGELPSYIKRAEVFCKGCLVLMGNNYESDNDLGDRIAKSRKFDDWQIVVLHDDADFAKSADKFLWATWTRFNPSTDIYAKEMKIVNNHISYESPIIIDARMKPWYPKELETREDIAKLVDERWREYFPKE